MQRLIQVAVSDASLLGPFCASVRPHLDGPATVEGPATGTWGLGFASGGELLVRKGPLTPAWRAGEALMKLSARHLLVATDSAPAPRHLEERQPLRHRDWLFAASGTESLGPAFATAAQALLPTYAFSHRRFPEPTEALMMLLMAGLERANARDVRDLTTHAMQRGLADGVAVIRRVMAETRVTEKPPGVVIGLHLDGWLFTLPVGRPVWYTQHQGTGPDPRPGRPPRHDHLRGLVISDAPPEGIRDVVWLPGDTGLEVGLDCEPRRFSLENA